MAIYVALLRGVTPIGKNKVPLAPLRDLLTAAGFGHVRTYIQSGNVFVSSKLSAPAIEQTINKLIKNQLGPDLVVVVRTVSQLQKAFDANPFAKLNDPTKVFFAFFARPAPEHAVKELLGRDFGDEALHIVGGTAYMHIPGLFTKAKLGGHLLEKQLGVPVTVRNFNTTRRLVEICQTHFSSEKS